MKTSVAVCTYNGEKFLQQQIDSILNQTHPVDEIIVCDDGSADATVEILNSYKEKYPELFQIHINEKNLRSVKNFEKAISLCTHEIIFLSDQDDIWVENKVEKYLNYFETHPEIEVIASNGFGIDEYGKKIDAYSLWDIPYFLQEHNILISYFDIITKISNIATGATMALKREFFQRCVPFPVIENYHHDEWLATCAAYENSFVILHEKLFYYRIHVNQQVGNVFIEKSEKKKKMLLKPYEVLIGKKSFSAYKKILKRLAEAHVKNLYLSKQPTFLKEIFEENTKKIELEYTRYKEEFRKDYPISYSILNSLDSLTQKRKIN
ncbi:glycosyltransferase family 2 protein [Chryseobacterium gambrini]|uniref:Glycosyltransferase family 2 protein n=1 Tax=Chryseobacterium gambrini TaxID=373672 RepID=A0AAJ1VJW3_9FLAO|nr:MULTISPECIES: glycosyltransferase family 2 protein [Chryseobacterium]MDN4012873.1 glycosyltransferase family 2 protein [Chryseobacterium gambrini]MDN4030618.1 glycosyltransferase family 2 protein [Chryseobacterium gambrini]QWA36588.1 glycosyltransferase family 2 protein [Chryseobacterium sp. ZHDP1]